MSSLFLAWQWCRTEGESWRKRLGRRKLWSLFLGVLRKAFLPSRVDKKWGKLAPGMFWSREEDGWVLSQTILPICACCCGSRLELVWKMAKSGAIFLLERWIFFLHFNKCHKKPWKIENWIKNLQSWHFFPRFMLDELSVELTTFSPAEHGSKTANVWTIKTILESISSQVFILLRLVFQALDS